MLNNENKLSLSKNLLQFQQIKISSFLKIIYDIEIEN